MSWDSAVKDHSRHGLIVLESSNLCLRSESFPPSSLVGLERPTLLIASCLWVCITNSMWVTIHTDGIAVAVVCI